MSRAQVPQGLVGVWKSLNFILGVKGSHRWDLKQGQTWSDLHF